jgi:hypothetical protein
VKKKKKKKTRQKRGNFILGYTNQFLRISCNKQTCGNSPGPFLSFLMFHIPAIAVSFEPQSYYHFVVTSSACFADEKALLCPVDANWCFAGRIQGNAQSPSLEGSVVSSSLRTVSGLSYYYSIFVLPTDPALNDDNNGPLNEMQMVSNRLCPLTNCREDSGTDEAHCRIDLEV